VKVVMAGHESVHYRGPEFNFLDSGAEFGSGLNLCVDHRFLDRLSVYPGFRTTYGIDSESVAGRSSTG
jgi:hypothetical protein